MKLINTVSKEKLRGGFYTPEPIAAFILKWAFNGDNNLDILEPSCGDGVFLEEIKKGRYEYNSVTAIEYDEIEAKKSRKIKLEKSRVIHSDFHKFCLSTKKKYNLIILSRKVSSSSSHKKTTPSMQDFSLILSEHSFINRF